MTVSGEPEPNKNTVSAHLRGETMAYALQSGIYNLAANCFEPYINYRVQKYYSGTGKDHQVAYGNYPQNLAGELAGDVIGSSALILAEALFPEQTHFCTRAMRGWVDPLYTSVAHRVFAKEKDTPGYEKKVEDWKIFQERNLVRSLIIATAGIAGNITVQKTLVGNPSPARIVFAGKLASTALTTTIGLVTRLTFPDKMRSLDNWISKKIFVPFMEDAGKKPEGDLPYTQMLAKQHNEAYSGQKNIL